jgi:hypothetical protein
MSIIPCAKKHEPIIILVVPLSPHTLSRKKTFSYDNYAEFMLIEAIPQILMNRIHTFKYS